MFAALACVCDAFLAVDPTGRVVHANEGAGELLGEPREALLATDAASHFRDAASLKACLEAGDGR
ncbi:MAG TPA: PAS domain-containing protein, partial [Holophaga sp.]|nr:PAS domain-containing protein [Holophaga sp.]